MPGLSKLGVEVAVFLEESHMHRKCGTDMKPPSAFGHELYDGHG